jgi:hypothetical protein
MMLLQFYRFFQFLLQWIGIRRTSSSYATQTKLSKVMQQSRTNFVSPVLIEDVRQDGYLVSPVPVEKLSEVEPECTTAYLLIRRHENNQSTLFLVRQDRVKQDEITAKLHLYPLVYLWLKHKIKCYVAKPKTADTDMQCFIEAAHRTCASERVLIQKVNVYNHLWKE